MRPSKSDSGAPGEGSLQSQMQMQPTRNQKYISTERAGNYSPIRVAEFSLSATSVLLQDSRALFLGGNEESQGCFKAQILLFMAPMGCN